MSNTELPGAVAWRYTAAELWADAAIHVAGLVLVMAGLVWLLISARLSSSEELLVIVIYGATLTTAITCSAIYNMWPVSRTKWLLRRLDHSAIYLLIAGTYTPFMFKLKAWWLLTIVWAVAWCGIAIKLGKPGRFDRASIVLYLALGWSALPIGRQVVTGLQPVTLWLIGIGGALYSLGVIFHLWERLPFQNAIWHGFVLSAAVAHFGAVSTAMFAAA